MFSYQAYGLNLWSEAALPGLREGRSPYDVTIRYGKITSSEDSSNGERSFYNTSDGVLLAWAEFGKFLVRDGKEIVVEPMTGAEQLIITQLLTGPVFGVLLIQRGLSVYHASATAFPSGAAIFMAGKGCGKSTLAGALHVRGNPLISDDIAALRCCDRHTWVIPGIPQLKLWPESIEAIHGDPGDYPKVKTNLDKRILPLAQEFHNDECALQCVYVLESGPKVEILSLNPNEAIRKVAYHWYGGLFQGGLLRILGLERHFQDSLSLVKQAPVFLLKRPQSLDLLSVVCEEVECHVESIRSQALKIS